MAVITRGFGGRRRDDTDLPPGQYRMDDLSLRTRRERTEVHTATGSTAWCFWSAGTSVYAAS